VEAIKTAQEAVAKVIEVDDFAPEALSPIYRQNHPATATAERAAS
jgi:acyl-CoA dehydrogenase